MTKGVNAMLAARATVDAANRLGETPLIVAVQQRQVPIVAACSRPAPIPTRPTMPRA